jgi:hypothetical protein
MPMSKPLGCYVSLPKKSQHYERIQSIESKFGSFFQQLSKRELLNILAFCSCTCASDDHKEIFKTFLEEKTKDFGFLNQSILFSLIPFIHSVINERENAN